MIDSHHIIHARSWFLRENRFLFLLAMGREITLKPATVLASAIICMVGVSVIFLSTIFASYSAIEVMRDESIQTAEASVTATKDHEQRTIVMAQGGTSDDDTVMWQNDIEPHAATSDPNSMIAGKTSKAPKPLPSRFNTKPQINAPSAAELSGDTALERQKTLPKIINTDDRGDTNQASSPPNNFLTNENADAGELRITEADASDTNLQSDAPIMDLALATNLVQNASKSYLPQEKPKERALDEMAGSMITNTPPLPLPDSNSAEYASAESVDDSSFIGTAAGFAIAKLPKLLEKLTARQIPKRVKIGQRLILVTILLLARLIKDLPSAPTVAVLTLGCHQSVMRPERKKCCYH